jgi:hypothetical protein
MNPFWKTVIWEQFGATIDSFENALRDCPEDLWHTRLWKYPTEQPVLSEVWYVVYHTLFWLDLYLTGTEEGFLPPAPFTLIEQDETGPIPERAYRKAELQAYLAGCRERCHTTIEQLTDEQAQRMGYFGWGALSFAELLLYNMRHVQEHTSQLGMLLGQLVGTSTERFVTRTTPKGTHPFMLSD